MVMQSLAGLPAFLLYFSTAVVAVVVYLFAYTFITPHKELALIRENCVPAAVSLGMSLLGFALPLASAIAHSANVIDCAIWALIALMIQLLAYFLIRLMMPALGDRIAAGDLAPALWLGFVSLSAGVLNAACMTY
jgi:putative membrane protein